MTERSFDDAFWTDPFVQDLSKDAKLLYAYAFTNTHCNQAGLYQITFKTIAFESGLEVELLSKLFDELQAKLVYYPETQMLWAKNFLKRQTKSPKFLIAAARCLEMVKDLEMVKEFLLYNEGISIPYRYPRDRVSIPPTTTSDLYTSLSTNTKSDSKEGVGVQNCDLELLALLRQLSAWIPSPDDEVWLGDFIQEFPMLSIGDVRACRDRWDGKNPAKDKGDWKNRLRNWMRVESRRIEAESSRQRKYRTKPEDDPEEFAKRYGHLGGKKDDSD